MNDNKYQSIISLHHNSTISSILLLEDKNYVVTCGREETKFPDGNDNKEKIQS